MNNKAQLDFDMDTETVLAGVMGIAGGLISVIVITMGGNPAGFGFFGKIVLFALTTVASFFVSKFIMSR